MISRFWSMSFLRKSQALLRSLNALRPSSKKRPNLQQQQRKKKRRRKIRLPLLLTLKRRQQPLTLKRRQQPLTSAQTPRTLVTHLLMVLPLIWAHFRSKPPRLSVFSARLRSNLRELLQTSAHMNSVLSSSRPSLASVTTRTRQLELTSMTSLRNSTRWRTLTRWRIC